MKIKRVNIIEDILASRLAIHDFGKPVNDVLEKVISEVKDATLLVLNLKRANPLDYKFVEISLTSTIKANTENENLFLYFLVDKPAFLEFCMGVVDILGLKLAPGEDEPTLLSKNGIAMIYENEKGETNYLTHLSEKHLKVLDFIDLKGPSTSAEILTEFDMIAEETMSILAELKKNKFIHQIPGPQYISIKSLQNSAT